MHKCAVRMFGSSEKVLVLLHFQGLWIACLQWVVPLQLTDTESQ